MNLTLFSLPRGGDIGSRRQEESSSSAALSSKPKLVLSPKPKLALSFELSKPKLTLSPSGSIRLAEKWLRDVIPDVGKQFGVGGAEGVHAPVPPWAVLDDHHAGLLAEPGAVAFRAVAFRILEPDQLQWKQSLGFRVISEEKKEERGRERKRE